jgi:hypothetical protein
MPDLHPGDAIAQHPTAIDTALAIAGADLRDRHHETGVSPWFMAPCGPSDHLYATCPGLRRSLRPGEEPVTGRGVLYPEAGDVCGLCLRWWRARNRTVGCWPATAYRLDVAALYRRLDAQRAAKGLLWKQVAEIVGISAPTFSRIAAGSAPDAHALVSLLVWLDLDTDIAYLVKPRGALWAGR